jgi:hypothetical protein
VYAADVLGQLQRAAAVVAVGESKIRTSSLELSHPRSDQSLPLIGDP